MARDSGTSSVAKFQDKDRYSARSDELITAYSPYCLNRFIVYDAQSVRQIRRKFEETIPALLNVILIFFS